MRLVDPSGHTPDPNGDEPGGCPIGFDPFVPETPVEPVARVEPVVPAVEGASTAGAANVPWINRQAYDEEVSIWAERAAALRAEASKSGPPAANANATIADVKVVGEDPYEVGTLSGRARRQGTADSAPDFEGSTPTKRAFGHSERKVLNTMAQRITRTTVGEITMFTELQSCRACRLHMSEFAATYKYMRLEVIFGQP